MARDESRRPTPRSKPAKVKASPKPKAAPKAAPKPKAKATPKPKAAPKPKRSAPASTRLSAALPARGARSRSGAPEQPRERRARHQRGRLARTVALVALGVCALAVVALVALFALRNSPAFAITKVEFEPTEHVSSEDVGNLAQVSSGSTLLNVDTAAIEESLRKNPWVASASFEREFPGTLKIRITEKGVDALVLMGSGTVAWYLADDGTWIEPLIIEAAEGQSVEDAALAAAEQRGCLLVTDVPATVEPEAGKTPDESPLEAVAAFREGFSKDFSAQVACYSAPSADNVSCVLKNGVEVSLGAAEDITEKERIVRGYLDQHEGAIVLINVRVVSNPAFREIASENVQGGSGTAPETAE